MFQYRTIWALVLALYVCVLIWQIMVQDRPLLEADLTSSIYDRSSLAKPQHEKTHEREPIELRKPQRPHQQVTTWDFGSLNALQHGKQQLYAGKHLLAERSPIQPQSNETIVPTELDNKELLERRKYHYRISAGSSGNLSFERDINYNNNSSNINNKNEKTLALISYHSEASRKDSMDTIASLPPSPSSYRRKSSSTSKRRQQPQGAIATEEEPSDSQHNNHSHNHHNSDSSRATHNLPHGDFPRLIDLNDFHYLMVQPACSARIKALILVHSAPYNYEKRMLIRETWGGFGTLVDPPMRLIFLLGAVEDESLQFDLKVENAHHGDMVQGSFVDDYRNMTYKHMMAFKWFLYDCPDAQILIKLDDDIYLNTPLLLKYYRNSIQESQEPKERNIASSSKSNTGYRTADSPNLNSSSVPDFNASASLFQRPHGLLFCQERVGAMVKRSYRSKWRVSAKEYVGYYYPPYCPGYAIIYSPDVVRRLYLAAQGEKYFWIDDVYITGVLAQQTNISITTLKDYILCNDMCENILAGRIDLNDVEFLFAWHLITPQQIRALWQLHLNAASSPKHSSSSHPMLPKVAALALNIPNPTVVSAAATSLAIDWGTTVCAGVSLALALAHAASRIVARSGIRHRHPPSSRKANKTCDYYTGSKPISSHDCGSLS